MAEATSAAKPIPGSAAVTYEIAGPVCILRLANPPVNAMRFADWHALSAFYARLHETGITVCLITGLPGRHFCAGNDFTEFNGMTEEEALAGSQIVRDVPFGFRKSPVISVAVMHGAVMGGGLIAASGCDIRLGTKDGKIGLPEVKAGAFGGYRIAQEVLPAAEARYLAFSGDPIGNERAYQLGFFQKIYDSDAALWDGAMSLAGDLRDRITGPYAHAAKTCVYESSLLDLDDGYDREIQTGAMVLSSLKR